MKYLANFCAINLKFRFFLAMNIEIPYFYSKFQLRPNETKLTSSTYNIIYANLK